MNSETPETDAFLAGCHAWQDQHWVDFARETEREVIQLRAENIQLIMRISKTREEIAKSDFTSDSSRIDWMQEHCCEEGRTMAMPRYAYHVKQWSGQPGKNLRWAIDDARRAPNP